VVVNDLGGSVDGSGSGSEAADRVVAEITDAGGEAVANGDGVHTWAGGEAIVATAIDAFGRIDVVVNNAGILRDVSFAKLGQEHLQPVLDVHLAGAFHVTRATWPHLREQGFGRIVCTTSGSGLYGNFGQSNYAAAKMGLVGLTRTLAIEGARHDIHANAIAPIASSRMTEDVMPAAVLERLQPEHVSPLVAYLCAPACEENGSVFSVGGGYVARVAIVEGEGIAFGDVPTVEQLAARFDEVRDLGDATEFRGGLGDQVTRMSEALGIPVEEQA
jgi:NAD(P)-dependent dehydrogenase (short-subunit alcohol dehydrogenase family)